MTSPGYLRFPHLHGDLVAFTADDDVWLAPLTGGRGWRLSADRAPVRRPRFSRDGTRIAWTSRRHGQPEILVAGVDGGDCRRLTYWADPSTLALGWTAEGEVLALTAAGSAFERLAWAHLIPPGGGAGRRLPFGPLADLVLEPPTVVALNGTWGRDPAHWKRYRGGTAGRLWVSAGGDGERGFSRVLADLPGQFGSPMLAGGRLVFLSDHEGTGNVYSCRLDGSDLQRHTDHDGFYARQASTDGHRVVYQCAGDIWLLEDLGPGSQPRRLDVTLGSAVTGVTPRLVSAAAELGALSCDETGRGSAIEVQGTIHWLTHRDGPARALSVEPAVRARLPQVLGRSGQVAWITDAAGDDALEIAAADGSGDRRRLAAGELGRVSELAAAPDGRTVAAAAGDGRLHVVDVGTGAVRLLAHGGDGAVSGLSFSPDSAWLAWSEPGPRPMSRIRLARLDGSQVIEVTDGRFADEEPVFSTDGKHLAFLSRRSFDPVYDAHFFDLSFPYGCRPYLVPLAAATLSPFGPEAAGRAVSDEPATPDTGHGPALPATGEAAGQQPPAVTVDPDGLAARVVPIPVPEAQYSALAAVTGGFTWLRQPVTGVLGEGLADPDADRPRPALERFDLGQRRCTELLSELDWYAVSGDGQQLVIRDGGELRVVPSQRKEESDDQHERRVDLSRARFLADPAALRRNALEEAGRFMRHDFWVPDLADVDWEAVLASYRPLLPRLASADDFADLLAEMFGELGASHAYVRAAGGALPDERTGLLGADLEPGPGGSWLVSRIVPGESSDPRARSPLAAPGAAVTPGTALLAVDGRPVDPVAGPGPLLAGAAGKPVELTVSAAGGGERRIVVTPLASERRLRYQDWVATSRRRVRELSEGRAGYLHVPDMMGEGWAHFHRDLRAEMARDTLIVDVRHNRGGHVSELVVEKLARRIMGWDLGRWLQPATYPRDAPRGPVVALADEFAGSDGDMVTAAIRILGLGPVVGARTWGGVIGIDGFHTLADGTAVTVPRYAIWLDGYGWGVENHGVDPDVEVVPEPGDWAGGGDPQLETAVRLALDALAGRPAARPPDTTTRPSRQRAPLPPRPAA